MAGIGTPLIQVDGSGLAEFAALLQRLGDRKAEAILLQARRRIGKSVRRQVVEELRSRLPSIPFKELNRLVTWNDQTGVLRFKGTGRKGSGFVRPRHLGLALPRAGTFQNAQPRFGKPTTSVPTQRTYHTGFVMVPGKGTKRSGGNWRKGDTAGKMGRNMRPWDGSSRGATRATLFRRTSGSKYPITQVPGMRLAELTQPMGQIVEQARVAFVTRLQAELERRLAVELKKRR